MKILKKMQGIAVGSVWTTILIEIFGKVGTERVLEAGHIWTLGNAFSVLFFIVMIALWTDFTIDYFKND